MPLRFGDVEGKQAAILEHKASRADEAKVRAAMAAIRLNPKNCYRSCGICGKSPLEHGPDASWVCTPIALWRQNLRHLGHKWLVIAMKRIEAEEGKYD